MIDHPERWSSPFTQVEMRRMWTYRMAPHGQGVLAAGWHGRGRELGLVDQATGTFRAWFRRENSHAGSGRWTCSPMCPGSRRSGDGYRAYGTALVDLVLDRNPFMLANGPRRAARPHALMVPRSHRDGWSSATAAELAARRTAMTLVAGWFRSLDGGHVVFCANDSAPNLDYLRDLEAAGGTLAGRGTDVAITRNPRQDVQHAHLHAFYAEHGRTENHESSALQGHPVIAEGHRAFSAALGSDAVQVERDSTRLAAGVRVAAQPWGGNYCSYQLGVDGPLWVMPALGPSQDEVNRRLARADGLRRSPTRRWAGPSTWCGPAWPMRSGSMRRNGPQLTSGPVSRPSWPSAD